MPRSRSIFIQSDRVLRRSPFAFTCPARLMAPPNSKSFSVSVVLPASGCEMIAKVRRRAASAARSMGARLFTRPVAGWQQGLWTLTAAVETASCAGRLSTMPDSDVPPTRLSERLASLAGDAGTGLSLGELLGRLSERGHALLVLFLVIPFLQPIPLPLFSTAVGLTVALIGLQMALERPPWLPSRLARRHV